MIFRFSDLKRLLAMRTLPFSPEYETFLGVEKTESDYSDDRHSRNEKKMEYGDDDAEKGDAPSEGQELKRPHQSVVR